MAEAPLETPPPPASGDERAVAAPPVVLWHHGRGDADALLRCIAERVVRGAAKFDAARKRAPLQPKACGWLSGAAPLHPARSAQSKSHHIAELERGYVTALSPWYVVGVGRLDYRGRPID